MNVRRGLAGLVLAFALAACGASEEAPEASEDSAPASPLPESVSDLMTPRDGQLRVLLLGMEGCAETRAATTVLAGLAGDLPAAVALARIDVPPPGGTVDAVASWTHPFLHDVDADRRLADSLDFFYYPTLYVVDDDGEVRFAGGCEREKLRRMIDEILAEGPGDEKTIYTPPVPAVGSVAPDFAATSLAGEAVEPKSLREKGPVVLLFSSLTCPFSREAVSNLAPLEWDFEEHAVTVVTVETGADEKEARAFYDDLGLDGPVVRDGSGEIRERFGVEPVPFYFLVGSDGTIAARGPFTDAAARHALGTLLGLETDGEAGPDAKGAG